MIDWLIGWLNNWLIDWLNIAIRPMCRISGIQQYIYKSHRSEREIGHPRPRLLTATGKADKISIIVRKVYMLRSLTCVGYVSGNWYHLNTGQYWHGQMWLAVIFHKLFLSKTYYSMCHGNGIKKYDYISTSVTGRTWHWKMLLMKKKHISRCKINNK